MDEPRLIPLNEVLERVPVGRTTLYALVKQGSFPKPTKVGDRSLWSSEQITKWINARFQDE